MNFNIFISKQVGDYVNMVAKKQIDLKTRSLKKLWKSGFSHNMDVLGLAEFGTKKKNKGIL